MGQYPQCPTHVAHTGAVTRTISAAANSMAARACAACAAPPALVYTTAPTRHGAGKRHACPFTRCPTRCRRNTCNTCHCTPHTALSLPRCVRSAPSLPRAYLPRIHRATRAAAFPTYCACHTAYYRHYRATAARNTVHTRLPRTLRVRAHHYRAARRWHAHLTACRALAPFSATRRCATLAACASRRTVLPLNAAPTC